MEINPNHPTTQAVHDHWHKLAALLMHKLGQTDVCITTQDLASLGNDKSIVVQELSDGLHLRIVSNEEGLKLAREHGGLPI